MLLTQSSGVIHLSSRLCSVICYIRGWDMDGSILGMRIAGPTFWGCIATVLCVQISVTGAPNIFFNSYSASHDN